MANFNNDEANKTLGIAIEYTKNGKYEEALKSANEARLMNPELPDIKRLVTSLQVLSANPGATHYEILGVEETANINEIRLAYRKLAVNINPDINNFPKASEAFSRINEAMEVLSNDKVKYDSDLAVARTARARVAEFGAILGKDFIVEREALDRTVAYPPLLGKDFIVEREALDRAVSYPPLFGKYFIIGREALYRAVAYPPLLGKDFIVDREALGYPLFGKDSIVEREALHQAVAYPPLLGKDFIVEREALGYPLFGKDFIVEHEALDRAVAYPSLFGNDFIVECEALGKDFIVDPEALVRAVAKWNGPASTIDGMISSSDHQVAFLKEKAAFEGRFDVLDKFDGMVELQDAFEAYDKEPQSTTHHPSIQKGFVCSSNEVAGRGTKRSNTAQSTLTYPVPKKKMDGQGPLFFK